VTDAGHILHFRSLATGPPEGLYSQDVTGVALPIGHPSLDSFVFADGTWTSSARIA